MPAWRRLDDGLAIAVRVTPRSALECFAAGSEDHFTARLNAPPVEGAVNQALVALVAGTFDVAKRKVTVIAGQTARLKRIHVAGEPDALARIAAGLYGLSP